MTLLLDTIVLIDALRSKGGRRILLEDLVLAGHDLSVAAVSVAEIYAGILSGEEAKVASVLSRLLCFDMDAQIAKRAGLMRNAEARSGRTMSLPDAMIAATAMEYGQTLVTDNRGDFRSSGVSLFAPDADV